MISSQTETGIGFGNRISVSVWYIVFPGQMNASVPVKFIIDNSEHKMYN